MTFSVRIFEPGDKLRVRQWWIAQNQVPPDDEDVPDTSFILEIDGRPEMALSVILWNTQTAMYENFIGRPDTAHSMRMRGAKFLVGYCDRVTKAQGYRKIFAMAPSERLAYYYQRLGFTETLHGVHTFAKGL